MNEKEMKEKLTELIHENDKFAYLDFVDLSNMIVKICNTFDIEVPKNLF